MKRLAPILAALALLPLAACATTPGTPAPVPPPRAPSPAPSTLAADDLVTASGTFFETAERPLFLCLGGLLTSYPPQCGGAQLPVAGIAWADLPTGVEVNGIRFTDHLDVTGTWDGTTFKVRSAEPAKPSDAEDLDFGQACEQPTGTPITTPEQMQATQEAVASLPGVQTIWVGYTKEPRGEEFMGEAFFNVLVTGGAAEAERILRSQVDTAVCVAHTDGPSEPELITAQRRLHEALGTEATGSGMTVRNGQVALTVTVLADTPDLRAKVADAVGPRVALFVEYDPLIRRA